MAPQRFHEQFDQIQRSMPDVPLALGPDDAAEFIYEKGVVLARDGEEARIVEDNVRTHFTAATGLSADQVRRAGPETNRSGITRIQVGDPAHGDMHADRAVAHALRALREPEGRAGHRLISRNHVVSIAVNSCPGDEPVPAPLTQGTNPAAAEGGHTADSAVGVLVVDNGLTHDYASVPLLAHVQGDLHGTETDSRGNLLQYIGHGTFIAGLVAAVAPNTDVTVRSTLNDAGAILESEFGERLFDAVDRDGWPDVISLSAGTSNGRTDGLLGVAAFMEELRQQRTLLVAAAGNNASATPFWPAAYAALPEYRDVVLSVGALRGDGEFGACFSNHGPWVNAYAPGERLTSALTGFDAPVPYEYQHSTYDDCRYGFTYVCTCQSPRHTGVLSENGASTKPDQVMFEGFAHWSGTSFATPVVAGMIAAHMTAHKETDPRAARKQLIAANGEFAEVRGAHVPALRPATWRPVPVVQRSVPAVQRPARA
ncbi:S8/S53 family peptidase [Streptomyces lincolnensis]|uniref:S8/S53 family peptidase n=1 Tax=Streptomyces lincolnensis TaxID=1915 RepID=UPI001E557667|nr:S8/S53 family peptidase [Streptomyces lincolnensis]MCD7443458.1 S8/S53 family peptidase [Streptomyces lincolnensis]